MIDTEMLMLTAKDAVSLGLKESILAGTTKVQATYKSTTNGFEFTSNSFIFKDKYDELRAGKFLNETEFLQFRNILKGGNN